ncbi:hypothetical protein FE257_007210 [Aspergillus nanangensis]|uniref:DUF1996 domain-containing protein n=1 Tax=Aspergillus nanangensis TaxID=2582783 RepID=A0AAD4CMZ9_ASPNN|nr:hypothetical protein FE257_007210 [Aspergillus nanangensis]
MQPGRMSSHTHVIVGGTAFQQTMGEDDARNAASTTCGVDIDKSNYWIPQLYHRMANGGFELIEMQSSSIYYFNRACNYSADATACGRNQRAMAPPRGLRMLAGDPTLRRYNPANPAQRAISHMCLQHDGNSSETKPLPQQPCKRLRSQVFMPSCWDGKNLDSPNHKSHMSYPAIGDYNKGVCPESHPVAIYSIFLEFFYHTAPYRDYKNWVYAMGDPTGYGLHGDFINGWTDQQALQNAITTCTSPRGLEHPKCSITRKQKRNLAPITNPPEIPAPGENIGQRGPLLKLPGHNPVTG